MTVLHLVRHCDVENPDGLIYGRLPGFGLSAYGCAQAERVGLWLADHPIAAIYTSPQLRAVETAAAIRRHHAGLRIRRSCRLAEVFTSYQGMKIRDVPSTINMFDNPKDPGDETMVDVFRRMKRLLDHTLRRYPGSDVVWVSHAAPISILRAGLEGRAFTVEALRGANEPARGSITTIDFDGERIREIRSQIPESHVQHPEARAEAAAVAAQQSPTS